MTNEIKKNHISAVLKYQINNGHSSIAGMLNTNMLMNHAEVLYLSNIITKKAYKNIAKMLELEIKIIDESVCIAEMIEDKYELLKGNN